MTKDFLVRVDFQKNKKIIFGGLILIVIFFFIFSFSSSSSVLLPAVKNSAQKSLKMSIPAMGKLPALDVAMKENRNLRSKVKELLSYDENYLFVNYLLVNDLVTEIMFLWSGLTPEQIKQKGNNDSAEYFIRYLYNLPEDEPIKNNPLLEKYPWASLFQKIKADLLMQGQGRKIYEGIAYYDGTKGKMVIEGQLSQSFSEGLAQFIETQPKDKHRKYRNNYLTFINETLGLKNLSDKEKEFLKNAGFL